MRSIVVLRTVPVKFAGPQSTNHSSYRFVRLLWQPVRFFVFQSKSISVDRPQLDATIGAFVWFDVERSFFRPGWSQKSFAAGLGFGCRSSSQLFRTFSLANISFFHGSSSKSNSIELGSIANHTGFRNRIYRHHDNQKIFVCINRYIAESELHRSPIVVFARLFADGADLQAEFDLGPAPGHSMRSTEQKHLHWIFHRSAASRTSVLS